MTIQRRGNVALQGVLSPSGDFVSRLLYPSRHDDTKRCLALFSRAADAIGMVLLDA